MDAIEALKQDVQAGRIDVERLVDVFAAMDRQLEATQQQLEATQQQLEATQQQLEATQQQLGAAKQRIEELEKKSGGAPTAKVTEPFSMRAEEQRQEARGQKNRKPKPKGRRGRLRTSDKIARAERTEAVYPEGVPPEQCHLSHTRPVWRLENGRAVLVAYQIYCGPKKQYGRIPGVLGRSEFGLEIVTEIAYLVYLVGLSFDKVCLLLKFFQNLNLRKSQADALLYQLSRHWEQEFDALCTLLAHSLVVHADETSWSLNSVWAFLSEKARVLLFGVPKDAATLKEILDPASFAGLVFSDDAAVYANFTASQKCWAHLLRKAIKLTLQDPDHAEYRRFLDGLLAIYREACRVQRDRRLGDAGRARKVALLDDKILDLCFSRWKRPRQQGLDDDYRLLVDEVMRLALHGELFPFVTAKPVPQPNGATKPVDGTNNEAERTLRSPAQARTTGRTNKTTAGARRQTILTSVLESLRLYLKTFTLSSVVEEIKRWYTTGRSCFRKLLQKLKLTLPEHSILDRVLPEPSG
jgi:transposase